ncbi:phosphoribosylanthranilate isomerase [Candidatus Vidania fulgoroideorum]
MHIKFCGIKKLIEIKICNFLKINNIGFIFYEKSKRFIVLKNNIFKKNSFGIFVNHNINYILFIIKKFNLKIIQLHGNNKLFFYKKIFRKIKSFFFTYNKFYNFTNIISINSFKLNLFLIENIIKYYGGSGKEIKLYFLNLIKYNFIVSGGISKKNISYFKKKKPYCLDISSGIEYKNKKNYDLMKCIKNLFDKL